jgi:hypothetical protein
MNTENIETNIETNVDNFVIYKTRLASRKADKECKPMTLLVRKYYHNKADYYLRNKDEIKAQQRERYANDEVYRKQCYDRSVRRNEKIKVLKQSTKEQSVKESKEQLVKESKEQPVKTQSTKVVKVVKVVKVAKA